MAPNHKSNALIHKNHDAVTHQGRPTGWGTELPKGSWDAGLLGLCRYPGVEELKTPPCNWNTKLLKSAQYASSSDLHQHLGVEEQRMLSCKRDTTVLQGPWDANPLGTWHLRIDEPPAWTKLLKINKSFQQPAHWNTELAKCPQGVDETWQWQLWEQFLFDYATPCRSESSLKMLWTVPASNYEWGNSKLQDCQARARTHNVISLGLTNTPSDPLEVKDLESPGRKLSTLSDQADSFKAHLPQPNILRSYAYVRMPHDNNGDLMSTLDPTSQETLHAHRILHVADIRNGQKLWKLCKIKIKT